MCKCPRFSFLNVQLFTVQQNKYPSKYVIPLIQPFQRFKKPFFLNFPKEKYTNIYLNRKTILQILVIFLLRERLVSLEIQQQSIIKRLYQSFNFACWIQQTGKYKIPGSTFIYGRVLQNHKEMLLVNDMRYLAVLRITKIAGTLMIKLKSMECYKKSMRKRYKLYVLKQESKKDLYERTTMQTEFSQNINKEYLLFKPYIIYKIANIKGDHFSYEKK